MDYFFAIIFPPIAFLMKGKIFQGIFNLILIFTIIGWIPSMIWALLVVSNVNAEERHREQLKAQKKENDRLIEAMKQAKHTI